MFTLTRVEYLIPQASFTGSHPYSYHLRIHPVTVVSRITVTYQDRILNLNLSIHPIPIWFLWVFHSFLNEVRTHTRVFSIYSCE